MTAQSFKHRLADFPSRRAWHGLTALLLGLAMAALGGLVLDLSPDVARRSVVLHASLAGVLLPLALIGQLISLPVVGQGRPGWTERVFWLTLAGATAGVIGLGLSGLGKPMLLSYFPLLTLPAYPALLVAAVLAATLHLVRHAGDDKAQGLVWLALPLLFALLTVAWSWTASAATPPHIREELVASATGSAWLFVLAALSLRGWLVMTEMSGPHLVRWTIAATLGASSVFIVLAGNAVDSASFLATLTRLQLGLVWLVPAALAVSLLRDPIRRAVGGLALRGSIAVFFLPLALAAWLILGADAASRDALRLGPLLLQHGLGLATLVSLWGAVRHRLALSAPGAPVASRNWRSIASPFAALAALGVVVGLLALLAIVAPGRLERKSGPVDEATRQHVVESRQREIDTRFKQGVAMMQQGQYPHAVTAFHRVLALDPTMPEAHVNMGFALLETGDPAGAQRFFESATRLNKNQLNAYYGLGLAAQAQGADQVAAGAMRTWLHLAPPDDPFRSRAEAVFDATSARARQQRDAAPDQAAKKAAGANLQQN